MIITFNDSKNISKVGNKAKNLILMKEQGFNVPYGIVLDSDTFIEEVKYNELTDKIKNLLKKINKDNIDDTSKKIIKLFDKFKFQDSTVKKVNSLLDKDKLYAVRSSGTKEDLEGFSFAGQYETFLNTSYKDIFTNVINCYKSMYSPIILSYFINNNISFDNMAMSVIVEEMVNSDYSGICFTLNPITGNDKEMLI